jgi:hypothetical protein
MRRTSVRRTPLARGAAAAAACTLLTGLVVAPATAATAPAKTPAAQAEAADPLPSWPERPGLAHRDVSVSGSGRVFDVLLPRSGYLPYSALEHGYEDEWSETQVAAREEGGVVTGPENYAIGIVGNRSYIFDGTSWSEPTTIAEGMADLDVVGNSDGDVAVLWTGPTGATYLSRHGRGGSWETLQVPNVPSGLQVRDVVLNDAGKTTVVWAAPSGETSQVRRSIVREGSSSWSTPQTVGTVNNPAPNLALATDGEGRETLVAGNQLFRQETTSTNHTFQFRTSVRAQIATGDTGTRIIWPVSTSGRYEIRTRYTESSTWRAEATIWSHVAPTREACNMGIELGVGMVPGGRAYAAVGIRRTDEPSPACANIADLVAVSRFDDVLDEEPLGTYTTGGPFQIEANTLGPVVVEYQYETYYADPMGDRDGYYSMRFFTH